MPLPLFKHKHRQKSPTVLKKTNTNLRTGIRGKYRNETEELRLKNEIMTLSDTFSDTEIMLKLGLPNSTFYRYKNKLYTEAREIWRQQYKESQEYRILHTINAINMVLRTHKEIILDKSQNTKDRLEACDKFVDLEMNFLKLINDMNSDNNDKTPHNEEELYSKPEWYDESKEKIWDSMTIPEKKDRLLKERLR